uniref:Uncharacterized protein n=1 Tax=Magnetococcus massalia (strain MO-1) TaxID=451514 RepID=A0A1S7LK86_MAGMO|nr:Exported protein of unknown function [Candidatus Magnetococcus massalia]
MPEKTSMLRFPLWSRVLHNRKLLLFLSISMIVISAPLQIGAVIIAWDKHYIRVNTKSKLNKAQKFILYQNSLSLLEQGLRWDSNNPDLRFRFAHRLLLSGRYATTANLATHYFQKCLQQTARIHPQRPSWYKAWLLHSKCLEQTRAPKAKIENSVLTASRLAPFKIPMKKFLLKWGTHNWQRLSPPMKKQVWQAIQFLYSKKDYKNLVKKRIIKKELFGLLSCLTLDSDSSHIKHISRFRCGKLSTEHLNFQQQTGRLR